MIPFAAALVCASEFSTISMAQAPAPAPPSRSQSAPKVPATSDERAPRDSAPGEGRSAAPSSALSITPESDEPVTPKRTPEPEFKFPLLQEGSMLARAPSTLRRDAESGTWRMTIRDDIETEADREVTILPCEVLEEMITHIRGRTEVQWFQLTAMVLTYRSHNYLLPLMATPLSAEPPRPPKSFLMPPGTVPERANAALAALRASGILPAAAVARIEQASAPKLPGPPATPSSGAAPNAGAAGAGAAPHASAAGATAPSNANTTAAGAPPAASAPGAAAAPPAPVDPERFAAEVERALEERIKVVPRSGDAVPVPSPFAPNRTERGLSEGAAPVLLPTHIRVQDRRGVVTRDPITGTWRFVMQGERADLGERGIELLPCAALERLERFVKQTETAPALLVSGRVTRFEGRNYLLPSSFRSIASGRWIYP